MNPETKDRVKRAVKQTLMIAGREAHAPAPRILTYHSVGLRNHAMNVTPGAFRAQMIWLAGRGDVIPLRDAAAGRPGIAITFDDGFVDNLEIAAPLLHELRLPATLFMVAGRAGGHLDHEPHPAQGRLMDWEDLTELLQAGIEIGGHTMTHARLSALPLDVQRREIVDCKAMLEDRLGRTVESFAYPYGSASDYTAESVTLVREAGYAHACSNRYGPNPPPQDRYALRRIWIDRSDNEAMFQAKVTGRLDALRHLENRPARALRRMLNKLTK